MIQQYINELPNALGISISTTRRRRKKKRTAKTVTLATAKRMQSRARTQGYKAGRKAKRRRY